MSEIEETGNMVSLCKAVDIPVHLAVLNRGRATVADRMNDRIMLLKIGPVDVLAKVRKPTRLHYDPITSQLYVAHSSPDGPGWPTIITRYKLP